MSDWARLAVGLVTDHPWRDSNHSQFPQLAQHRVTDHLWRDRTNQQPRSSRFHNLWIAVVRTFGERPVAAARLHQLDGQRSYSDGFSRFVSCLREAIGEPHPCRTSGGAPPAQRRCECGYQGQTTAVFCHPVVVDVHVAR